MRLLIKNIKELALTESQVRSRVCGNEMGVMNNIPNAYLLIEDGIIAQFGPISEWDNKPVDETVDAENGYVLPSFCDSHTHIVYAGSREQEFIDKIKGLSYEEIAKRGGGILNSAHKLHDTSEEDLFQQAKERVYEMIRFGTGAIEIKSGYGLTCEDELKMLRVIRRLKEEMPVEIKSTFLGAHAVPYEYKGRQKEYVDLIIYKMIPKVAREKLADFIDVFCDRGFFTVEETDLMLKAGIANGMRPKIHANELALSGGIQVGVANNALSVDHLEFTGEEEIECLLNSQTMPSLLPGAAFFLEMEYPPARKMIDSGLPLALSTDYNPGSSPSGDMKFILSLACIKMKMTPTEALNAATINGAYAMGISSTHGSIAVGKVANFFITKQIPSLEFLPYAYTSNLISRTFLKGVEYK
ncbi:MAG: imidazolonepropionase [Bacteroidales bacterium]